MWFRRRRFPWQVGHESLVRRHGHGEQSGNSSYQLNAATVEEMVMSTSGISADMNADGLVMNIVPKEGGNTFRTTLTGVFANRPWRRQPDRRVGERGLKTANKTIKMFDESSAWAGRSSRTSSGSSWRPHLGSGAQKAGVYWNKTQNVLLTPPGAERKVVQWTPWVDRPLDRISGRLEWYDSVLGRITWQANAKNKFNFTYDEQRACNCGR